MDPQTRKRKLVSDYEKDIEIARLKKQLLIHHNSHLFYDCLNSNNQKYMRILENKIHEILPESERIKICEAMEPMTHKLVVANTALRTKFSNFMTSVK